MLVPILLAVCLAAVAIALRGKGRLPETPEAAVRAFFAAAEQGDAAAYLSLVAGTLKSSFQETQSQLGSAAFRDSLRNSAAGLKGFAVSRSGDSADESAAKRAALDVELVFADRTERQRFALVRDGRGWAIESIDRAEVEKPAMPYGATVYDIQPSVEADAEPPPSATQK